MIEKARPEWQKGALNGIGGKLEEKEDPRLGMAREFREETGLLVGSFDWTECGSIRGVHTGNGPGVGRPYYIYMFKMSTDWILNSAKSVTDEPLRICEVNKLVSSHYRCIDNIPGIVSLLSIPDNLQVDIRYF